MTSTQTPYVSEGSYLIGEERRRQVDVEGYTPEYDDIHEGSELTLAALCYVDAALSGNRSRVSDLTWPWDRAYWKPAEDPVDNLVRAGALIAAEIERLRRVQVAVAEDAVAADDHQQHPKYSDECGTCGNWWHDDRCARWCEGNEPGAWCFECRTSG